MKEQKQRKATYKNRLIWLLIFIAGSTLLSLMMWDDLKLIGVGMAMFVTSTGIVVGMMCTEKE